MTMTQVELPRSALEMLDGPWNARSIWPNPTACSRCSCCAPGLLERHARHHTAHAALIAEVLSLLAGNRPASPPIGPQAPSSRLAKARSVRRR
jgi:hypothetical protein